MANEKEYVEDHVILYVNERQGNRPASVKTEKNDYFTISDATIEEKLVWEGWEGSITFFEKPSRNGGKPFLIATALNGRALPKDQRGGRTQAPASRQPQAPIQRGVDTGRGARRAEDARRPQETQRTAPAAVAGINLKGIETALNRLALATLLAADWNEDIAREILAMKPRAPEKSNTREEPREPPQDRAREEPGHRGRDRDGSGDARGHEEDEDPIPF